MANPTTPLTPLEERVDDINETIDGIVEEVNDTLTEHGVDPIEVLADIPEVINVLSEGVVAGKIDSVDSTMGLDTRTVIDPETQKESLQAFAKVDNSNVKFDSNGNISLSSNNATNNQVLTADGQGGVSWQTPVQPTPYQLPISTTSTLGGIKPDGETLTVNPQTGVASAIAAAAGATWSAVTGKPFETIGTGLSVSQQGALNVTAVDTSAFEVVPGTTTLGEIRQAITQNKLLYMYSRSTNSNTEKWIYIGNYVEQQTGVKELIFTSLPNLNIIYYFVEITECTNFNSGVDTDIATFSTPTYNNQLITTDTLALSNRLGIVKPDNTTITVNANGVISATYYKTSASDIDSGNATQGQALLADGLGGAQWTTQYTYGTQDLTPGVSDLATGSLYFVYEETPEPEPEPEPVGE